MRNPWPMFCVLAVTGLLCVSFPQYAVWLLVFAAVVLFLTWILLPIKFDDWFARKINPCIQEYQREHNFEKLESELNRWRPWALTKTAQNAIQVNLFCALLEQERWEDARNALEQIKRQAKTVVDWMNYHLLMAEYAQNAGEPELEKSERRLSEELKEKIETKLKNPNQPATAQQSRTAFLQWISFAIFLFIGGSVWIYLFRDSALESIGAGVFILSWLAFPIAMVWLMLWLVRQKKERSVRN